MNIVVEKEQKGLFSMSLEKISRQVIRFFDEKNEEIGVLSGDQLNEQLKRQGFEIVELVQ